MNISIKDAYLKGYRSGVTTVGSHDAHERFSRKYCDHPYYGASCDLDTAWWNGFDDSMYAPHKHALTCPLGILGAPGDCHSKCEER